MREETNSKLILPKIRGSNGNVSHFHHFFAGYYLPVLFNEPINQDNTLTVLSCGPMEKIWLHTPKFKFETIDFRCIKFKKFSEKISYFGYDGPGTPGKIFNHENIRLLKEKIFNIFDIDINEEPSKKEIIIINRGKAPEKDLRKSYGKKRGAQRRTIVNIDWLKKDISSYYPVRDVMMEGLSMRDQILLFRDAKAIIADHGSALSHMTWCSPNTPVFEICPLSYRKKIWFRRMGSICGLQHKQFINRVFVPADSLTIKQELLYCLENNKNFKNI
jgi:hypothetical protein